MSERIQRRRTKGWKMPPNTVTVSRPSKWGNPYTVKTIGAQHFGVFEYDDLLEQSRSHLYALAQCLNYYRKWAELQIYMEPQWLAPLMGKDLACWCKPDEPCHADILLEMIAEQEPA